MNIDIRVIPHSEQRYETVGDWYWSSDYMTPVLHIRVSDTGNEVSNFLLIIHELIEALTCHVRGVSQSDVDHFDMEAHHSCSEPGDHKDAPYTHEHSIATAAERMCAAFLEIKWASHEENIDRVQSS
jgi:hypothetical protein